MNIKQSPRIQENRIIENIISRFERNGKIIWRIALRVFLLLFLIFGVLGSITGFNIYRLFNLFKNEINEKIVEEFKAPKIKNTIEVIAEKYSYELIQDQISPEVENFRVQISNEISELKKNVIQIKNLTGFT